MSTTMRLEDEVKIELDRFQGLLQHETGERLTHSELLAKLLGFATRRSGEFIASLHEPAWRPPTAEEMRRLFSKVQDWGVETDSSRIDEELYGPREE
jgi:hypothetical protein